jgi:hypothetical protein
MLESASNGVSATVSSATPGTGFADGAVFFEIQSPTDCLQAISLLRTDCSQSGSGNLSHSAFAVKLS